MLDVISIGEALIDLTQSGVSERGVPVYDANPGGAPANLAAAAAKLGAGTAFIGKVGDDAFGDLLMRTLEGCGIDVSGMIKDPVVRTTLAIASVDGKGERSFAFYRKPGADVMLTKEKALRALKPSKILHFGSLSLTDEPSRTAVIETVKAAKDLGALISYDPNYRAALWPGEKEAVKAMKAPLPLVDIIKVAEDELSLLTGTSDPEKGSLILAQAGPRLVFVTLGGNGALCRLGDTVVKAAGIPVKVADTIGAGDAFLGAALSRLVKYKGLDELTADDLKSITAFANKAASMTVARPGAIPAMPAMEDLE